MNQMDLEEFILNPTDTLQSIAFQRGRIAAYETMEDYARCLGELQLQNASTPMFQTLHSPLPTVHFRTPLYHFRTLSGCPYREI